MTVYVRTYGSLKLKEMEGWWSYQCPGDYWCTRYAVLRGDRDVGGAGLGGANEVPLSVEARIRTADGSYRYGLVNPTTAGGQREWLLQMNPGDVIETRQWPLEGRISGFSISHEGGPPLLIEQYIYSRGGDGFGIAAEGVVPLRVVAQGAVREGEPVTFAAVPFSPDVRITDWYYSSGASAQRRDECHGQSTCTLPGVREGAEVFVYGRWSTRNHNLEGRSGPLRYDPPKLVLECNGVKSTGTDVPVLPDSLPPGRSVGCTTYAEPAASVQVLQWSFSAAYDPPAPAASPGWIFVPRSCGDVQVRARVNGVEQSRALRVNVVCPFLRGSPNDSILADPYVQAMMRRLDAATKATGLEQGVVLVSAEGRYEAIPFAGPSTPCSADPGGTTVPAGAVVVATFHTHPFDGGAPMPTDGSCHGNTLPDQVFDEGGSDADREHNRAMRRRFGVIPSYIIDPTNVHRLGVGSSSPSFSRNNLCPGHA